MFCFSNIGKKLLKNNKKLLKNRIEVKKNPKLQFFGFSKIFIKDD